MRRFEEWDILGRMGEKIVAQVQTYQDLKLALVHREIQRMADDNDTTITWDRDKLVKLKEQWQHAVDNEQELFTFENDEKDHEILVTYGRYLIEYLEYLFPKEGSAEVGHG